MITTTLVTLLLTKNPSIRLRYHPLVGSTVRHEVLQKSDLAKMGHQKLSYVTNTKIIKATKTGYEAIQRVESLDLGEKYPSSQSLSYRVNVLKYPVKLSIDSFGRTQILSSNSSLARVMSAVGLIYPERTVTVGDTWTQNLSIANLIGDSIPTSGTDVSGAMKIRFKIDSITNHQVRISVSGSGKMGLASHSKGTAKPDQVNFKASLSISGRYLVNRDTGVLDTSRIENRIMLTTDGKTMPLSQVFEARRL